MILPKIRTYLQEHRRATLGDLALHFDTPPEAMRGMVEVFVRKGHVQRLAFEASCNTSCPTACDDTAMTIYEWAEQAPTRSMRMLPTLQVASPAGDGCCRQHGS